MVWRIRRARGERDMRGFWIVDCRLRIKRKDITTKDINPERTRARGERRKGQGKTKKDMDDGRLTIEIRRTTDKHR